MADQELTFEGPGDVLRRAREEVNVSLDDVAQTLNLSARVVKNLEANDYEDLPVPAFTRGYIRAYAKLLELDADDLVEQFDVATVGLYNDDMVVSRPTPSISAIPQQHPGRVLGGIVALIVVGAALILWWIWPEEGFPGFDANDETLSVVEPARTEPIAGREGNVDTLSASEALRDEAASRLAVATESDAVNVTLADSSEASSETNEGRLAMGQDRLVLSLIEDCWVEVEDRNGATVHADLLRGGDSVALIGLAPFTITLGNAPAATLEFNGDPVALGPHTRNRIANLVLGR